MQLGKTGFGGFLLFWFFSCCRYKLNGARAYHAINIKLPAGVLSVNKVHCQL